MSSVGMLHKFFLWFISFFGMLSIFGIILGYLHLIYAPMSIFAIAFCAAGSYFIVKRTKKVEIKYSRYLILTLLVLAGINIYISLPYLIYPHSYVDFGLNVAQGRLVTQTQGFPAFVHSYPNIYNGVFAIFNSIILHAYTVSSLIAVIMQIMIVIAIFMVSKEVFDERVGLIASFLYGFSVINILLLEQGYLTQNFATFFFVSTMYLIIICSKDKSYFIPLVLSLVALMSYPHYFIIMFVTILVYFRTLFKYLVVAGALLSVEIVGLVLKNITNIQGMTDSLVMLGGIIVPNLIILSIFVFALFGVLGILKKKEYNGIMPFVYVISFFMGVFLTLFLVNSYVYTWRDPNIRQLYIVIKLLYLSFIPGCIIAAFFMKIFMIRHFRIIILFAILYFAFFANYSLMLDQKNNLPSELYYSSEFLSQLSTNNSIGFDKNMLQTTWKQPKLYNTLYGQEDNYTKFSVWELGFLLQSSWVKKENHYRNSQNIPITYTKEDVEYYVTDSGNFAVHDIKGGDLDKENI